MDKNPKLLVVSGFGRGHWLAAELVNIGIDVTLFDVTHLLGRWSPEDVEGPFGFFQTEALLQSQHSRLDTEDYSEEVEDGFSVWLKSGPVDMRSSVTSYLLDKMEVSKDLQTYLVKFDEWAPREREQQKKKIAQKEFHLNWLAQLAHSIASPEFHDSTESLESRRPLPVFTPLSLRRVSRRGLEKSFQWLKDRRVETVQKVAFEKIEFDKQVLVQLQKSSEHAQVFKFDQMLWALTSSETDVLQADIRSQLFSSKLEPEWVWVRYRVEATGQKFFDSIPKQFVVIEDLALSWTHSNLLCVQKTLAPNQLDVWMRIPASQRFHKSYLEQQAIEAVEILKSRMPGEVFKLIDPPAEFSYDFSTLGPSRFAQYKPSERAKFSTKENQLVHYDGPEFWETLDWTGQFIHQREIFLGLHSWKNEYDIAYEKFKAKEAAQLRAEEKKNERRK